MDVEEQDRELDNFISGLESTISLLQVLDFDHHRSAFFTVIFLAHYRSKNQTLKYLLLQDSLLLNNFESASAHCFTGSG